jgi:hypothetical protein
MRQGVGDTPSLHKYLTEYLPEGSRIGLDGSVHTVAEIRKLESALKSKGHKSELEVDTSGVNLVDTVCAPERTGFGIDSIGHFEFHILLGHCRC